MDNMGVHEARLHLLTVRWAPGVVCREPLGEDEAHVRPGSKGGSDQRLRVGHIADIDESGVMQDGPHRRR